VLYMGTHMIYNILRRIHTALIQSCMRPYVSVLAYQHACVTCMYESYMHADNYNHACMVTCMITCLHAYVQASLPVNMHVCMRAHML
jgi:hypothetical protein